MNDNDIIELLKVCSTASGCKSCQFSDSTDCAGEVSALALDLINRQKAEIERLKDMVAQNESVLPKYERLIKHEAIKEFAEKLKEKVTYFEDECGEFVAWEDCRDIDRLVEEMTGGENG